MLAGSLYGKNVKLLRYKTEFSSAKIMEL